MEIPRAVLTAAEWEWRQAAVSVAIAGLEEQQKDYDAAIIFYREAAAHEMLENPRKNDDSGRL